MPFLWLRTPPYQGNSPKRLLNMFAFAWRVWRECGLEDEPRPDVILGSSPSLLAAWSAQRLAQRIGVPFVFEIRDLWPETLVSLGHMTRWHPLVAFFSRVERYLYRKADRVVTVLPDSADYIATHGGSHEKVRYLPNGIDLRLAAEPTPPSENNQFTLMYAGAHGAANGLDDLLDAAKLLEQRAVRDRIRIELVGDGPEKQRLQLRVRDEEIGLVCFRDSLPKHEIYSTLQEADAFLMDSQGFTRVSVGL